MLSRSSLRTAQVRHCQVLFICLFLPCAEIAVSWGIGNALYFALDQGELSDLDALPRLPFPTSQLAAGELATFFAALVHCIRQEQERQLQPPIDQFPAVAHFPSQLP